MGYKRGRKKSRNVEDEEEVDRLSSLPDDVIHKILSFNGIKDAIRTSSLSSRWRYIWTSISRLDFSSDDFSTLLDFSKFVTHFLSRRNHEIEVTSLDFSFHGEVTQPFVKKLFHYAYSHNIQRLNVSYKAPDKFEFPLSVFSSESLKHLNFTLEGHKYKYIPCRTISTLELPALTTLYLKGLTLVCDNNFDNRITLFSKCSNLKNLTLKDCRIDERNSISICHPGLASLIFNDHCWKVKVVNVIAPQLEILTIPSCWEVHNREYVISVPNLTSLLYHGYRPLHLSTDGLHSLKEADICLRLVWDADAHQIGCMLQQFNNVQSLKLNLEIIEILSSSLEPILNQPAVFPNLKSLKLYPVRKFSSEEKEQKMSNKVTKYLLDNYASVTVTMVTRQDIKDKEDTEFAKSFMDGLRELLEEVKAKRADLQQTKMQGVGGRVKHVNRCWEDLSSQIEKGREKASDIISELENIKFLLKKLPTSKREELKAYFSSLCAEANMIVKNILDDMKIQCDMKERRFGVYFHELAQTL